MRKLIVSGCLLTLALPFVGSVEAKAQATRTWVSGVGDDANPCSRTAPCKTFAGAISKTAKDGEISVLDPGGYGAVTITKSITITGTPGAGYGSILNAGGVNGIIINITDPNDVRRTVRLNWLDINGASTGNNGIRILNTGLANSVVAIENCVVDGQAGRGISDERVLGGELYVSNTSIRNNAGNGITVAAVGGSPVKATLNNLRILNNFNGVTAGGGAKVSINNSVISGGGIGVNSDGTGGATDVLVTNSVISHNTTGLLTNGTAGAVARISNNDFFLNGSALSLGGGSTIVTFNNNKVTGAPGSAPNSVAPVNF